MLSELSDNSEYSANKKMAENKFSEYSKLSDNSDNCAKIVKNLTTASLLHHFTAVKQCIQNTVLDTLSR